MLTWLIIINLVLITLCLHIGISYDLPAINNLDNRGVKEFICFSFYCTIIATALFGKGIKPVKNVWLIILVLFLTMHRFIAPPATFQVMGFNIGGFWQYKPLLDVWFAFLVCCIIASQEINIEKIMHVLLWLGFILSCYAIIQFLRLDCWQEIKPIAESITTTNGRVSTTLTHPNFSAVFIASLLPLALFFRKWWMLGIMLLALVLIKSVLGIVIASSCLWLWWFSSLDNRGKSLLITGSLIAIFCSIFILVKYPQSLHGIDSGRFDVWQNAIEYTLHPTFVKHSLFLIGYGLGSFEFIFNGIYHLTLKHAHNEYIEMFCSVGAIGVVLLLCSLWWIISRAWKIFDVECRTWLIILIGLLIGSGGLYIWQVQPHQFLIVLVAGILHKKIQEVT